MIIKKPILGKITQGSIFTCAYSDSYQEKPVWGLCITARCDISNNGKTDVLSYLPVVNYDSWLYFDGVRIVLKEIQCDLINKLKSAFKCSKISESVLEHIDNYEIFKEIINSNEISEQTKCKIYDLHNQIINIKSIKAPCNEIELKKIYKDWPKIFKNVVKRLYDNTIAGFYYIESIGETDKLSANGYVILLREPHHFSLSVAELIAKGAIEADFRHKTSTVPTYQFFEYACVVSVINSPWIEYIMQNFSLLFSRIGLPDRNMSVYDKMISCFAETTNV